VGAGVVVLTGIGIGITGYGTPWAFLLALGIVCLPSLSIAALGAAIPSTGGTYTYVRDLLGHKTAFLYLGLLVAGQLVLATYAIGFADYADALMPGINLGVVAAAVMTLCFIANLLGVKTAARFQSMMVLVLIVSLLMFIGFGLSHVDNLENYTSVERVMPDGIGAFIAAAYILRFGMIGSEFISELGGETKDPGRNIPRVMITSLTLVTVLYMTIGIIATGVLPLDQVKGKSLAFVAKEIFPPAIYIFFVLGGVMIALLTTLNSIFAWCTKGLFMATQDGWLPHSIAIRNRFGTPFILLTLFYVVGMLPIVTGMTLQYVTILGNAVGIIFGIIPVLALYNLYDRNPEAYRRASFKLPVVAMKIVPFVALAVYAVGVYLSMGFIGMTGFVTLLVYAAMLLAYAFWREPHVIVARESALSVDLSQ
ncbi:MAG: APC family permease, partial [Gammaproteobacteria bacterium]|nr:APC family permease [Gammaproteobacteria bacterium]